VSSKCRRCRLLCCILLTRFRGFARTVQGVCVISSVAFALRPSALLTDRTKPTNWPRCVRLEQHIHVPLGVRWALVNNNARPCHYDRSKIVSPLVLQIKFVNSLPNQRLSIHHRSIQKQLSLAGKPHAEACWNRIIGSLPKVCYKYCCPFRFPFSSNDGQDVPLIANVLRRTSIL
jgi:hypothetical protein